MRERQDEAFRERLAGEARAWEQDGLITPEQGRHILARYPALPAEERAFRLNRLTAFIATTGALVFGAGVVLFFATNWDVIPAWLKVALVYLTTAAAYGTGTVLRVRREALPRVGEALILLGALLFQAGIFLLAQIYHLPVDSPSILGLGALGILPLAYAAGLRSVLVIGLLDGLAWIGWEMVNSYRDQPAAVLTLAVYLLAGVMLYAAGGLHRRARALGGFRAVLEVMGLLACLAAAYVLSFGQLWRALDREDGPVPTPLWFVAVVLIAAAAALSLAWQPERGRRRTALVQPAVALVIVLLAGAAAFAPGDDRLYPAAFNLLYFGLALLACVHGYLGGGARLINTGIPALALGLITRYVDVFGGLLPASAAYLSGGALLLVVAVVLERVRRRLLAGTGARV